jgi:hypothetical protein
MTRSSSALAGYDLHNGKTRKGSPWLREALIEAASAAGRTKDTYLAAQYHRLVRRRGKNKAAVGHQFWLSSGIFSSTIVPTSILPPPTSMSVHRHSASPGQTSRTTRLLRAPGSSRRPTAANVLSEQTLDILGHSVIPKSS